MALKLCVVRKVLSFLVDLLTREREQLEGGQKGVAQWDKTV